MEGPSSASARLHLDCDVIAFADGKGGVGKSSLTSNIAGYLAEMGAPTLIVTIDPQDNTGEDLGYTYTGTSDHGAALIAALVHGEPLRVPIRQVRPHLDVISSGPDAGEDLVIAMATAGRPDDALAQALLPLAADYDFILIDCPPFSRRLQRQALVAAQYLVVPTQPDDSSRKGIGGYGEADGGLAQEFLAARDLNPDLTFLGVVLFDALSQASTTRKQAREELNRELEGLSKVFESTIRTAKAPATLARRRGVTMAELARDYVPGWKILAGKASKADAVPASAAAVAQDYESLTAEILELIGFTLKAEAQA